MKNRRKAAIYCWRSGITKYSEPFTVEYSRKLTTKEKEALALDPYSMFRPVKCRIVCRNEMRAPYFDASRKVA
jgi:hypothetical protein